MPNDTGVKQIYMDWNAGTTVFNLLRDIPFRGNNNKYLHFMPFHPTDMTHIVEIISYVKKDLPILHNWYYGRWCPGDAKSRGIGNHDIYYVETN